MRSVQILAEETAYSDLAVERDRARIRLRSSHVKNTVSFRISMVTMQHGQAQDQGAEAKISSRVVLSANHLRVKPTMGCRRVNPDLQTQRRRDFLVSSRARVKNGPLRDHRLYPATHILCHVLPVEASRIDTTNRSLVHTVQKDHHRSLTLACTTRFLSSSSRLGHSPRLLSRRKECLQTTKVILALHLIP